MVAATYITRRARAALVRSGVSDMFGLVSEARYKQMLQLVVQLEMKLTLAAIEATSLRLKLRTAERATQFSPAEIESMIRLCHPDKHNNSPTANGITKKLLALRSK